MGEFLRKKNIRTVVNCTWDIRNYHEGILEYRTFDIAWWKRNLVDGEEESILDFLLPHLDLIEEKLSNGDNILLHCLAGAHRAGTAGILCLMHFAGLDAKKATSTARSLRSIIEPIGDFRQLLNKCDKLPRS